MARLIGLCAHLAKVLPDGADFEIVPWFVSEGRVMFVLTARVAIAPQQRRAAGGKRRGAAVGGKPHVGGMDARAGRSARRAAERALTAAERELVVPSSVADAATGVAAAPAADAPADAPAAKVSLLSQTLQVLLPALLLHVLFQAAGESIPEFITRVIRPLANWVGKPGKHSRSSNENSSGDDDGKRNRRA
ncbi:hypothetical protein T492DRAFT_971781 [Pavlovales sp. CCMP2436]|nr:hypothetical protein T492DRAFT_971781 [Pavlovales sp. CCMP2436]